jgi:hypothetical protein
MALKNVKVTEEDGTTSYYQLDESDEVGKAIKRDLEAAAKDPNNAVKSVTAGDPTPINSK